MQVSKIEASPFPLGLKSMTRFFHGIRFFCAILGLLMLPAASFGQPSGQPAAAKDKLIFFFSQSCNKCHEVKEKILSVIERDHSGSVEIEPRDIADIENYKLLLGMRKDANFSGEVKIPAVYYKGKLLVGKDQVNSELLKLVSASGSAGVSAPAVERQAPSFDLVKHFLGFTPFAIVSAGLIDGINPCAFTVIVFFISFLSLQGYSRKDMALIGSSFIIAVFLTYLLLGLGLLSVFYSLKGLWFLRKALNWGIGIFTLFLGILALRDILQFKKTGSTEGMALQLPGSIKNQIHKVIGLAYRKNTAASTKVAARPMFAVLGTAFATGFLVSLLEAVCTGQVYLPTITFVLKTTPIKLQAAGYLVLYNMMFIAPLVVIFLCALAGVTSGQFGKFLHRHFLLTKSLLAMMFFVFGVFLLWRG
jgi:hypothetical protein